jgi:hypothetical protein
MNMPTIMRKRVSFGSGCGLYPWGKAVCTDSWVVLHKHGDPKLAISFKEKRTASKISHKIVDPKRNN